MHVLHLCHSFTNLITVIFIQVEQNFIILHNKYMFMLCWIGNICYRILKIDAIIRRFQCSMDLRVTGLLGQSAPGFEGQSVSGIKGQSAPGLKGQTVPGLNGRSVPGHTWAHPPQSILRDGLCNWTGNQAHIYPMCLVSWRLHFI